MENLWYTEKIVMLAIIAACFSVAYFIDWRK